MKEECVTYKQAQELKRLGFRDEVFGYYDEFGRLGVSAQTDYNVNWDYFISAPTLSQAQKWLREEKGLIIFVTPEFYEGDALEDVKWYFYTQPLQNLRKQRGGKVEGRYYDIYELALYAGIDAALELLTDKLNDK